MDSTAIRTCRLTIRWLWFGVVLLLIVADYAMKVLRHGGALPGGERARWLQRATLRVLRILGTQVSAHGPLPQSGLLVCNHLSYLDILVIASLVPALFVSKAEIKSWPVFGWCARLAGTLFLDRTRRSDVGRMSAEMKVALDAGQIVVLFPEGTSSGGHDVLPFRSSLLEPVCTSEHSLTVAHLGYEITDGSVENDVCYWRDMTFFPHLLKLMTKRAVQARVKFAAVTARSSDRKELARQLHAEVVRLKAETLPG